MRLSLYPSVFVSSTSVFYQCCFVSSLSLPRHRCSVKQPSTLGSSRMNSAGSYLWRSGAARATTQPSEPTRSSPKSECVLVDVLWFRIHSVNVGLGRARLSEPALGITGCHGDDHGKRLTAVAIVVSRDAF